MKKVYIDYKGQEREIDIDKVLKFLYHASPVVRNEVEKCIEEGLKSEY